MAQHSLRRASALSLGSTLLFAGSAFAATDLASWTGLRGVQIQNLVLLQGGLRTNGTWDGSTWQGNSIQLTSNGGVYYQISLNDSFNAHTDHTNDYLLKSIHPVNQDPMAPDYVWGAMFHNDYQWYTFGGVATEARLDGVTTVTLGAVFPPDASVTQFDAGCSPDRPVAVSDNITSGAYASSPDQGLGYYFGGMASATRGYLEYNSGDTDPTHPTITDKRFIQVDMTKADNAVFSELTYPGEFAARSEGALVWVPYGEKGSLIAIGGASVPGDLYLYEPAQGVSIDNPFMTQLVIYDIHAGNWYTQNTTETSQQPGPLAAFCHVAVPTQNGDGYEIFVYGGYDGSYASADPNVRDDVWVLSIPAFQWTKLDVTIDANHARQGSVCMNPNPSTMITIGGSTALGSSLNTDRIVDVLNLNTMEWTGIYDASSSEPLKVRPEVVKQLGNWDENGPTSSASVTGLDSDELNTLFANKYQGQLNTYYPYASNSSNAGDNNNSNGGNNSSDDGWKIPVIATVCTVVPLLVIAAIVFCCLKKRRKNKEGVERTQQSRRNVFSWLGKSPQIDPAPDNSHSSDETAVASQQDYLNQKGAMTEVHEVPNNPPTWKYGPRSPGLSTAMGTSTNNDEPVEIMSQPGRESMSIHNHPYYPRSLSGNHILSTRSDSISHPSEAMGPTRHYGHISPYEMAHDKSNENITQPPNDLNLGQSRNEAKRDTSSTSLGVGAEQVSSPTALTPTAAVGRKPISSSASPISEEDNRPKHQRNQSSISSSLPVLPSPTVEEDRRRSKMMEGLPDVPSSSEQPPQQQAKKSIYQENFDKNMGQQ